MDYDVLASGAVHRRMPVNDVHFDFRLLRSFDATWAAILWSLYGNLPNPSIRMHE